LFGNPGASLATSGVGEAEVIATDVTIPKKDALKTEPRRQRLEFMKRALGNLR
jgi:hypothetical protein